MRFYFPVPPEKVEIENHENGSAIEVKADGEVQLTCIVKEGKPAAKVSWFRQNVKLDIRKLHIYNSFWSIFNFFFMTSVIQRKGNSIIDLNHPA